MLEILQVQSFKTKVYVSMHSRVQQVIKMNI
jgi:hypothetical protein